MKCLWVQTAVCLVLDDLGSPGQGSGDSRDSIAYGSRQAPILLCFPGLK